jgi:hypothetical protein
MQHLPDVVRTRLDTWYPSHLPARFRPRAQQRPPRLLRPLPLALAALLLVLLAAGAAAGPTRALTDAIVNLAGSHPAATPTPRARSEVRSATGRPGAATITVTPEPANPAALAGPTLIRVHRTASGSRTMAPIPVSSSDPLAAGSPPPSALPPLPQTNSNGSPGDQPSPPPSPSAAPPVASR